MAIALRPIARPLNAIAVMGILYPARVRSRILAVALGAAVVFACSEKPDAPAAHDEAATATQPVAARPESLPRNPTRLEL